MSVVLRSPTATSTDSWNKQSKMILSPVRQKFQIQSTVLPSRPMRWDGSGPARRLMINSMRVINIFLDLARTSRSLQNKKVLFEIVLELITIWSEGSELGETLSSHCQNILDSTEYLVDWLHVGFTSSLEDQASPRSPKTHWWNLCHDKETFNWSQGRRALEECLVGGSSRQEDQKDQGASWRLWRSMIRRRTGLIQISLWQNSRDLATLRLSIQVWNGATDDRHLLPPLTQHLLRSTSGTTTFSSNGAYLAAPQWYKDVDTRPRPSFISWVFFSL